jgi:hypothetical protein
MVIVVAGMSGALIWRAFHVESVLKAQAEQLAGVNTRLIAIGDQVRDASGAGKWRSAEAVHHTCSPENTSVTCTFTNLEEWPVRTCVRGRLIQKGAQATKLESVVMCTGKLDPAGTRVITVPWVGGTAESICFRETAYRVKKLDWEKCKFGADPVHPANIRGPVPAASR